ncbi:MARCO-like protein isoform X2 [Erinaceus europaeus]|uniref:MARCO-like protein isoform X2 n=1 Tax=Erinaceus europaeus TaxID=9365 RepID=A0ABM3WJ44_ERIEU|nr:MARCO-like protein isoform X2 [Erinaceus europaeus]
MLSSPPSLPSSASSTQVSKSSFSKPGKNSEPALILVKKNDANNQERQKENNKQGSSNTQVNKGTLILQGQPGYSNQPGKPGNLNQQGIPEVNQPEKGKPGSSSQQGKPGTGSLIGKPEASSPQDMPMSYNQERRKNANNPLNDNTMEIQVDSTNGKNPKGNRICQSIYKPVCGSDGKTYGNRCVFNEAKRLSHGKLTLNHEGKC